MPTARTIIASFVFTLTASAARGDVTHLCADPPNKAARVAVRDNVAVGKTQDRNSGTCTFSIDGAKAASPSAQSIRTGLNSVRAGARVITELQQKRVDNLAYAMLSTAPVSEIPADFRTALSESAGDVANCLKGFFSGGVAIFPVVRSTGVAQPITAEVGRAASASQAKLQPVSCGAPGPASIESGDPKEYVEISVTWGNNRFLTSLVIPRKYPSLQPLTN